MGSSERLGIDDSEIALPTTKRRLQLEVRDGCVKGSAPQLLMTLELDGMHGKTWACAAAFCTIALENPTRERECVLQKHVELDI